MVNKNIDSLIKEDKPELLSLSDVRFIQDSNSVRNLLPGYKAINIFLYVLNFDSKYKNSNKSSDEYLTYKSVIVEHQIDSFIALSDINIIKKLYGNDITKNIINNKYKNKLEILNTYLSRADNFEKLKDFIDYFELDLKSVTSTVYNTTKGNPYYRNLNKELLQNSDFFNYLLVLLINNSSNIEIENTTLVSTDNEEYSDDETIFDVNNEPLVNNKLLSHNDSLNNNLFTVNYDKSIVFDLIYAANDYFVNKFNKYNILTEEQSALGYCVLKLLVSMLHKAKEVNMYLDHINNCYDQQDRPSIKYGLKKNSGNNLHLFSNKLNIDINLLTSNINLLLSRKEIIKVATDNSSDFTKLLKELMSENKKYKTAYYKVLNMFKNKSLFLNKMNSKSKKRYISINSKSRKNNNGNNISKNNSRIDLTRVHP